MNAYLNIMLLLIYLRKRHETAIKELDANQETMKDSLGKIQSQIQQAKLKMAVKS
jgi:hypothetical protein